MDNSNNQKDIRWILPTTRNSYKKVLEKFEQSIELAKKKRVAEDQIEIAEIILKKYKQDGNYPTWTEKQYFKFAKIISYFDFQQTSICKKAIVQCLTTEDNNILMELQRISELVEFYPEMIREYNREEKKYKIAPKQIEILDCFSLMSLIYGRIYSFLSKTAQSLSKAEDYEILYQTLKEVSTCPSKEKRQKYLENFQREFDYVKQSILYQSIYHYFEEHYFALLLNLLRYHYDMETKIQQIREDEYFRYKTVVRSEFDKRKAAIQRERYIKRHH